MTRPSSGRSGLIGLRRQRSGDGRDVVSRGDDPGCLSPCTPCGRPAETGGYAVPVVPPLRLSR